MKLPNGEFSQIPKDYFHCKNENYKLYYNRDFYNIKKNSRGLFMMFSIKISAGNYIAYLDVTANLSKEVWAATNFTLITASNNKILKEVLGLRPFVGKNCFKYKEGDIINATIKKLIFDLDVYSWC
jgi:hypothetical protein